MSRSAQRPVLLRDLPLVSQEDGRLTFLRLIAEPLKPSPWAWLGLEKVKQGLASIRNILP